MRLNRESLTRIVDGVGYGTTFTGFGITIVGQARGDVDVGTAGLYLAIGGLSVITLRALGMAVNKGCKAYASYSSAPYKPPIPN